MKLKNRPTVLLLSFIYSPNIGGVESHLDDLVESLIHDGFKIKVITYQPITSSKNAPSFEKHGNLEIRRIPWLKFNLFNKLEKIPILEMLYLVPPIFLFTFWYLLRNNNKIDLIQSHGFNMAIVGSFLSTIFRKKLVVNTHVSFNFIRGSFYSRVLALILNKANKILVLTHAAGKELTKIGINKEKVVVYHQWIDTKLFRAHEKEKSRKKMKLDIDNFLILFTGRFIPPKGVDTLLEASKKVPKNVQIIFVGSGPMKEEIANLALKNKSIVFIGEIPKEDLPYYYSSADICIIPSRQNTKTYSEGIPRVMIEAFTCGTPVIATNSGGLSELITADVGFFTKPTSGSILKIIRTLVIKRNLLKRMNENCIKYSKRQFNRSANIKIIEESLL